MRWFGVVTLCIAVLVVGCYNEKENQETLLKLAEIRSVPDEYLIGVQDILLIEFRLSPEMNRQVLVGPHGRISMPIIGEVEVVGKTVGEVSRELTSRYAAHYTTPDVYVSMFNYAHKRIYIFGEIIAQGEIPVMERVRLIDAIARAGGPTIHAQQDRIRITRSSYDKAITVTCDLQKLIDEGDMYQNPVLLAGDIVYVPPTPFAKLAYVAAEVGMPITPIFTGVEESSSTTYTIRDFAQQGLGR